MSNLRQITHSESLILDEIGGGGKRRISDDEHGDDSDSSDEYEFNNDGYFKPHNGNNPFITTPILSGVGSGKTVLVEVPQSMAFNENGTTTAVHSNTQIEQPVWQSEPDGKCETCNKPVFNTPDHDIEKDGITSNSSTQPKSIVDKILDDGNVETTLISPATGSLCMRMAKLVGKLFLLPLYVIRYLIAVAVNRLLFTPPDASQFPSVQQRSVWFNVICSLTALVPFGIMVCINAARDAQNNPMPLPNNGHDHFLLVVFVIKYRVYFYIGYVVSKVLLGASERRGELPGLPFIRKGFIPLMWIHRLFNIATFLITLELLKMEEYEAVRIYIICLTLISLVVTGFTDKRPGLAFTLGTIVSQISSQVCTLIMLLLK